MTNLESKTDDPYAKQIYAKQVRAVYGAFMIAIGGSFIGAFLLLLIQWDVADKSNMLLWFSLFSSFQLIRGVFIYKFNKLQPEDDACVFWGEWFVYSTIVAGLIWSLGLYVTFVPDNLSHQLTISIITVGLSAGAVSTLSVLRSAFVAYVSPIMLTLVILFLSEATYSANIVAFIIFSTMIFITRGANNYYLSNMTNFRLLLEAADREKLLVAAKVSAEIANKTQSEFLDNMSHELRTPLHGIMGFTQVGLERTKEFSDKDVYKYFSRILESSERLKILLDDLLDLRKIEEGKVELDLSPHNLQKIIIKCVGEQEAVINSHNIQMFYEFDSVIPLVNCDEDRMGQIIMNVLSNAIKFSPEGGRITFKMNIVVASGENKFIQVSISDEGPGIDKEEQETIFNKFIQIKKNISNSGGTGLGLAITKEIVNAHHGKVWCESNRGRGVTFHFTLPI